MICSDGESSVSRYAGVGRQLLPDKPLKEILKNLPIFGMPWYEHKYLTLRMARVSCDGESSISGYAGVGRQLLPEKPLKEISKNELDNFLTYELK